MSRQGFSWRLGRHGPREAEAPPDEEGVAIVAMRRRHVRDVCAIERDLFPRPWTSTLFLSELAQPATRRYYVAVRAGAVVGYAGMMVAVGEGHVTTIGVEERYQRRGIATRLLLRLAHDAREAAADSLTLEVRASNLGAQRLYHAFGFAPVGIRKNYYPEVNEDAIVMWAHDVDSDEYGARLAEIAAGLGTTEPEERR